jgi:hypothetical protein
VESGAAVDGIGGDGGMTQDGQRLVRKPLLLNLAWVASTILGLAILYFLSIGPVLWLAYQGAGTSFGWIEPAYAPLSGVKRRSPVAARLIDGYISLWVDVFPQASDDIPPDLEHDR